MLTIIGYLLFTYLALKECKRINASEGKVPKWRGYFGAGLLLITWIMPAAIIMQIAELFEYDDNKIKAYTAIFISIVFMVFSVNYISKKNEE